MALAPALAVSLDFDIRVEAGSFRLELALSVPRGVTVLYGPSGAGKSLTLGALAGLVPAKGMISLDGAPLAAVPAQRRRVGLVAQDGLLFPHLSVRRNLRYGGADRFDEVVSVLELGDLLDRMPPGLSGGERQRVALGRALLASPRALLMDEPLASLDRARRARIVPYLLRVAKSFAGPILYVTHALDEALALGERVCVIDAGRKVTEGAPLEVFGAPGDELVPRLSGFENLIAPTVTEHVPADSVTRARLGGVELLVPLVEAAPGERVFFGLAASEIIVAVEEPRGISARNVLPTLIAALGERDGAVLVRLALGDVELVARVVPSAVRALGLEPGRRVFAVVKTSSFRPLAV